MSKLHALIKQESFKANQDFLIQQDFEYKNLCAIEEKLEELDKLLEDQAFTGKSEDSINKVSITFQNQVNKFIDKISNAISNKSTKTREQLFFTQMGLASIAIKELKK